MKRIYRGIGLLLSILLLFSVHALAEQPSSAQVTPVKADNAYGSVTYPVLQGLTDISIMDTVNKAIFDKAQIQTRLDTLNRLTEGGWGLTVTYEASLKKNILSVNISALGEMENGRMGHVYTALAFDLATGKQLTLDDIFSDAEGAFSVMEQKLEEEVAPYLSGYMENDSLTPVPRDNFYLTPDYITFYYPQDQFSMLSGLSGGASFDYYELAETLNLSEGSPLSALEVGSSLEISESTAEQVKNAVSEGVLPGIGAKIGDRLMDRLNQYRLLVEPDYYPGGRFFEVEAPELRSIWLLTDALTESYDSNQVLGIRADRVNLYGIRTGMTSIDSWREALGQPESTVELDDSTASDYRLPAGTSDYYTFGQNKLRLHADETGVLVSVQVYK